jgi:hypothetical protein
MNRSFEEILNEMLTAKAANTLLDELDTESKVSIWRQFLIVIAWCIFNFQKACNLFLQEIKELIATQKVFHLRRYRFEALRFQYGFDLIEDSDQFKNTYLVNGEEIIASDDIIQNSKIIKYAACSRLVDNGRAKIVLKIAPENMNDIFSSDVMKAFIKFLEEIAPAGDHVTVINYLPDLLKFAFRIKYDPMVLLNDGMNIVSGKYPVKDAIEGFLKNLPFNGELSIQKLEAAILAVDGVVDLETLSMETKWIDPAQTGYGLYQPVIMSVIPASGRFKVEDFTGLQFIV